MTTSISQVEKRIETSSLSSSESDVDVDVGIKRSSASSVVEKVPDVRKGIKWYAVNKPTGKMYMIYMAATLLLIYVLLALICPFVLPDCATEFANESVDGEKCYLITNDESLLGVITGIGLMVWGFENSGNFVSTIYFKCIPSITHLYFLPGVLFTTGVYNTAESALPGVATKYLLTFCLVALCAGADLKQMAKLGWRSMVCFFAGTVGVMLGGPIMTAFFAAVSPSTVCDDETWRGLAYLAGSWIGGGANATAMADIFETNPNVLSIVITVDSIVGMLVMLILITGVGHNDKINKLLKADTSAMDDIIARMIYIETHDSVIPTGFQIIVITFGGFFFTGVSNALGHVLANAFDSLESSVVNSMALNSQTFWRVMIATIIGFSLSFTKIRKVENWGASKIGTAALQFLILTIGMSMDITAIGDNPMLFLLGFLWVLIHLICVVGVGCAIRAPYFYMAVGSQANIGAAASAPVVAAAFNPVLAPVGALYGIFGYIIGTWCAWGSTLIMREAVYGICENIVMRPAAASTF